MEKTILVDMDGVVTDFVSGVYRLFGKDLAANPVVTWNFFEAWDLTAMDFWGEIDRAGEAFWVGLQPYPWAQELFDFCRSQAPVYFCSSAALSPFAWSGKIRWIRAWVNHHGYNDIVLTTHKHLLARPTNFLIDDNDDNVTTFRKHGGPAALFPQGWNSARELVGKRLECVKDEVIQWLTEK